MTEQSFPDVVIVGGGAAGSSAALVLGRARANVLVIDAGQPSNAPSPGIGGLLGNDGTSPADFYRRAGKELAAYPTVRTRSATVTSISPTGESGWRLETDDGGVAHTDRILLAMGMRYDLPRIEGIASRWGSSVFHCPFCHGWEHRDQPLAVLGGPSERALLLRRWTDDLTLITHGEPVSSDESRQLGGAGIRLVEGVVASLHGPDPDLNEIRLTDGRTLAARGLMVPAPHRQRQPSLLEGLGLTTTTTGHLATDTFGATNVAGIWAAGDLTSPMASVARAVAEGSNAAAAITRDLVVSPYAVAS